MNPLKRILILLLIPAMLVNSAGYFLIFQLQQRWIRSTMMNNIRRGRFHEEIIRVKIIQPEKQKDFHRVGKREFILGGRYYDIVVEHKSGDTVTFYCLHDKKEESLVHHFRDFMARGDGSTAPFQKGPLRAMVQNLITEATVFIVNELFVTSTRDIIYPQLSAHIVAGFLKQDFPPPKVS